MSNEKRNIIFLKVPLEQLIKTLMDMYEAGAEYVDIMQGEADGAINNMGIIVQEEYLSKYLDGPEQFMENIKAIVEEEWEEEEEEDEYNPNVNGAPKMDLGDIIDGSI